MANTHDSTSLLEELWHYQGDWMDPWVLAGGLPTLAAGLTTSAFATWAYTRTAGVMRYVQQPSASVTLTGATDGPYTLGVHADTTGAVGDWVRQPGTHYLWILGTIALDAVDGVTILCGLTVTAGAITAITDKRRIHARVATSTREGWSRFATTPEINTGTDGTTAVTPAGLAGRLNNGALELGASALRLAPDGTQYYVLSSGGVLKASGALGVQLVSAGGGVPLYWDGTNLASLAPDTANLGSAIIRFLSTHTLTSYVYSTLQCGELRWAAGPAAYYATAGGSVLNLSGALGVKLISDGGGMPLYWDGINLTVSVGVLKLAGALGVELDATSGGVPLYWDGTTLASPTGDTANLGSAAVRFLSTHTLDSYVYDTMQCGEVRWAAAPTQYYATASGSVLNLSGALGVQLRSAGGGSTLYWDGTNLAAATGVLKVVGELGVQLLAGAAGTALYWDGTQLAAGDNLSGLGHPVVRWKNLYVVNAPIVGSDEREKRNITDEPLGLSWLQTLRPRQFQRLDTEAWHHGLIAQEVATVVPPDTALVVAPENPETSTYALMYEELIGPLIKGVQELAAQVTALTSRVADLEGLLA